MISTENCNSPVGNISTLITWLFSALIFSTEAFEKKETDPTPHFEISRGISPNDDLKNESFELKLLENAELEYFKIFDKNGLEKHVRIQEAEDNGKIKIIFENLNNVKSGTYFYVLDLGDGSPFYKGTIYLNR